MHLIFLANIVILLHYYKFTKLFNKTKRYSIISFFLIYLIVLPIYQSNMRKTFLYSPFLIISQIVELLKAFPYTAWKFHHNTYDDKWKYGEK
ncbi:hypothetical protein DW777_08705 [Bacteroides sp. AM30-16]|nr:hypothetical protein DW777_08705 [Bacteroides sp. AM30-16]